jgi:hypothetical protein
MKSSMIALALLLMTPLVSAQVYKWKDASGTVHYSQTPPPGVNTKFKEMKPSSDVEATPAAAPTTSKSEAATPAPTTTTVADTPENRSKLCTSLQTNLAALNGSGAVVMQQGGKQTALDDSQRKQQAAAAQTQYQQYCAK